MRLKDFISEIVFTWFIQPLYCSSTLRLITRLNPSPLIGEGFKLRNHLNHLISMFKCWKQLENSFYFNLSIWVYNCRSRKINDKGLGLMDQLELPHHLSKLTSPPLKCLPNRSPLWAWNLTDYVLVAYVTLIPWHFVNWCRGYQTGFS